MPVCLLLLEGVPAHSREGMSLPGLPSFTRLGWKMMGLSHILLLLAGGGGGGGRGQIQGTLPHVVSSVLGFKAG